MKSRTGCICVTLVQYDFLNASLNQTYCWFHDHIGYICWSFPPGVFYFVLVHQFLQVAKSSVFSCLYPLHCKDHYLSLFRWSRLFHDVCLEKSQTFSKDKCTILVSNWEVGIFGNKKVKVEGHSMPCSKEHPPNVDNMSKAFITEHAVLLVAASLTIQNMRFWYYSSKFKHTRSPI